MIRTLVCISATTAAVAATTIASADSIDCSKPNTTYCIPGPNGGTVVTGTQGNDKIKTPNNVPATVKAGDGIDEIKTGFLDDIIDGGDGNNQIGSGPGDDIITTGKGNSVIHSGRGNDSIHLGLGNNIVNAGPGDDVIHARQGTADFIDCGTGDDTVFADRHLDGLRRCEHIRHRGDR